MATPQRTSQNEGKIVGGSSNRIIHWDLLEARVWSGGCDSVAIPLWRGHVQGLLRSGWCSVCAEGIRGKVMNLLNETSDINYCEWNVIIQIIIFNF